MFKRLQLNLKFYKESKNQMSQMNAHQRMKKKGK